MVPIYKYSAETARYENELTDYRESKRWNIKCKDAIEEAIRTHFDGMHLDTSCVQDIFDEFGYDRTMWVLAATVKNKSFDGRFSNINKGWARTIIPSHLDKYEFDEYAVQSHPAVLNGFIDSVYIGEFNNRDEVIAYLKKIGVDESYINSNTVGDGSGDGGTHWRIESNGSQGCVINNRTDGKQATALNMFAFRVSERDVTFEIDKYNKDGNLVGKSAVDNSSAVYGIYSDKECTKSVGTITIGADGKGTISLPRGTYYAKEIKAPTGYEVDTTVYTITPGTTNVTEDYKFGSIRVNKTAEDGVIADREFKVSWTENGKEQSKTSKTNSTGVASFPNLKVYDISSGNAISYTVSEINTDERYVVPKAQDITLTNGNADLTVDVKFENTLKKFTAEITKKDSENITAQGDATLAGATYGLYHDGNRIATYTTDENGHFVTDEFVCGNYTLQELTPSQGYQLNDEIYKVGAEPQNYKVEVNPIALDVTEDVVKGKVSMWRDLVMRHISDISKAQKIPLTEMKWYAAFHDTTHHPHIHLIVYSKDPRQGYLTKDGIEQIRSAFANDIFHDELQSIYQEQTLTRDELKALSEDQMSDIVSLLGSSQVDERLVVKVRELYDKLQSTKGNKVYGYLPKDVKQTVDDIFLLLSQNGNIQKLYDKWCEFEKAKYRMYTQKDKVFPDLVENKEFRSVKNMIIREVLKADILPKENDISDEIHVDEESITFEINEGTATAVKKRKQAQELINNTNAATDMKKGIEILDRLANDGDELSMYKLAKLLLDDNEYHDTAKAVELLKAVADKNMWASYRLGRIYLFGAENVEPDKTKAVLWLTNSAEAGNEYAENLLNYSKGEYSSDISNTVVSLLVDLGRFIKEDNARHRRNISAKVDKKLQRMIQKKKQELGIKSDGIDMSYNY